MRVLLPLSVAAALVLAIGSTLLTGCMCGTMSVAPRNYAQTQASGLVVATDGTAGVAFASWAHSLHTCDPDVVAPAVHAVRGEEASTTAFAGYLSRVVRVGGRYVAVGSHDRVPSLFIGSIDEPFRVDVTVLQGPAFALVAAADRAFFLVSESNSVRVVGDVDAEIPTVASPSALAVGAEYVYVASATGAVSEIDANALVEIRRLDGCPASAIAPLGSEAVLLACDPSGLGVLDLASGSLAVTATADTFVFLQGTHDQEAAIVATDSTARVFVRGSGLLGDGVSIARDDDYWNGGTVSDVLFLGTSAIGAFGGRLTRISLVTGEASLLGIAGRVDALSRAGGSGVAVGRFPPVELGLVRFDLSTADAEEVVPLDPPPEYYRWR